MKQSKRRSSGLLGPRKSKKSEGRNGKMKRQTESVRRIDKQKKRREKLMKKKRERERIRIRERKLRRMKGHSSKKRRSTETKRRSMHVLIWLTTASSCILNPQAMKKVKAERKLK